MISDVAWSIIYNELFKMAQERVLELGQINNQMVLVNVFEADGRRHVAFHLDAIRNIDEFDMVAPVLLANWSLVAHIGEGWLQHVTEEEEYSDSREYQSVITFYMQTREGHKWGHCPYDRATRLLTQANLMALNGGIARPHPTVWH